MQTYDFNRSYLRFRVDLTAQAAITLSHKMPTSVNNARITVEAHCAITEKATGKTTVYALGASCKTERVGDNGPLWIIPNADFCLTASTEEFLIIKSWQKNDMGVKRVPETLGVQPERQVGFVKDAWVGFGMDLKPAEGRELSTIDQIIAAIRGDKALVSHTEYEAHGYRVEIDHPIKTINYSEKENVFQTDTGPLILPDLSPERRKKEERFVGVFDLAFSAFNAPTWGEFIVNVPTPLGAGLSVNHYSKPVRIEGAKNRVIEVA